MNSFIDMVTDPFMQRSLLAAAIVGLTAPIMGTYLVQRRLSLLGDGIGHVALTGVALGWMVGSAMNLVQRDALAIPGAIVAAIAGALASNTSANADALAVTLPLPCSSTPESLVELSLSPSLEEQTQTSWDTFSVPLPR